LKIEPLKSKQLFVKRLILLYALLATSPVAAREQPVATIFECVGRGGSNGYPGGRQEIGETKFSVQIEGQIATIIRHRFQFSTLPEDSLFCRAGAKCSTEVSDILIRQIERNVPDMDPGYVATFELDRKKRTFVASGGGLDGGWSITGACEASNV